MLEFRIYEHPLLPQRIVKKGFSWPALLIGPPWLLFKKLWTPAAIALAVMTLFYFVNRSTTDPFLASTLCSRPTLRYFEGSLVSEYTDLCESLRDWYEFLILLVANLLIAADGNSWWAADLSNRGYVVSRTIKARSLDDARAILARESAEFTSTQPHHAAPGRE